MNRMVLREARSHWREVAVGLIALLALVYVGLHPLGSRLLTVDGAASPAKSHTAKYPDATASESQASRRVLIVDIEHKGKPNRSPARIRDALRAAGASELQIAHFSEVDGRFIAKIRPAAIVLSGQATPWWDYPPQELVTISGVVRGTDVPVLGICGGHQLLAKAFGGEVAPIRRTSAKAGYAGCVREKGWRPIRVDPHDALFRGIGPESLQWLNHCEEVKVLPKGFCRVGSDARLANQAIRHRDRPVYGLQFHPEVASKEHPDGTRLLRNFLLMAGVRSSGKDAPDAQGAH